LEAAAGVLEIIRFPQEAPGRAQPCQRCSPVLQALIIFQMQLYGSASAEPFFAAHFSGELGSTTAHLRRLPRKGRAGGAYKTLLKHRVLKQKA